MSYTKHTWQTGETIIAENLNHIQQGIKDAPGYNVERTTITFVDETITTTKWSSWYSATLTTSISDYPEDITVIFNGTEYTNLHVQDSYYNGHYYGEMQNGNLSPVFTTYPFLIMYNYYSAAGSWEIYTESAETCSVKLKTVKEQCTTTDDFDMAVSTASESFNFSDRIAKGKNSNNPVKGAIILGDIETNIASGDNSHAEGYYTTASGWYSHAEGSNTTASSNGSHAEGHNATASGWYSHVEGDGTTASGDGSHAEGNYTTASGGYSHAEGLGTTASKNIQHVFGKYNIVDTSNTGQWEGTYVEIVGDGTYSTPSNARTLDWSGNEKIAGSLTLGLGTANEVTISPTQLAALLALLNN